MRLKELKMEPGSPQWISQTLEELEGLELERESLYASLVESSGESAAKSSAPLAHLDQRITALYDLLEPYAGSDDEEEAEESQVDDMEETVELSRRPDLAGPDFGGALPAAFDADPFAAAPASPGLEGDLGSPGLSTPSEDPIEPAVQAAANLKQDHFGSDDPFAATDPFGSNDPFGADDPFAASAPQNQSAEPKSAATDHFAADLDGDFDSGFGNDAFNSPSLTDDASGFGATGFGIQSDSGFGSDHMDFDDDLPKAKKRWLIPAIASVAVVGVAAVALLFVGKTPANQNAVAAGPNSAAVNAAATPAVVQASPVVPPAAAIPSTPQAPAAQAYKADPANAAAVPPDPNADDRKEPVRDDSAMADAEAMGNDRADVANRDDSARRGPKARRKRAARAKEERRKRKKAAAAKKRKRRAAARKQKAGKRERPAAARDRDSGENRPKKRRKGLKLGSSGDPLG